MRPLSDEKKRAWDRFLTSDRGKEPDKNYLQQKIIGDDRIKHKLRDVLKFKP